MSDLLMSDLLMSDLSDVGFVDVGFVGCLIYELCLHFKIIGSTANQHIIKDISLKHNQPIHPLA